MSKDIKDYRGVDGLVPWEVPRGPDVADGNKPDWQDDEDGESGWSLLSPSRLGSGARGEAT